MRRGPSCSTVHAHTPSQKNRERGGKKVAHLRCCTQGGRVVGHVTRLPYPAQPQARRAHGCKQAHWWRRGFRLPTDPALRGVVHSLSAGTPPSPCNPHPAIHTAVGLKWAHNQCDGANGYTATSRCLCQFKARCPNQHRLSASTKRTAPQTKTMLTISWGCDCIQNLPSHVPYLP